MTGEANLGGPSDEVQRQELIQTVANAVLEEDYEFVVEVAGQQSLLRPFEMAEYMDVKRRTSEDPVEQRRWGDAARAYVGSVIGQEFPPEEVEAINAVIRNLNFDDIVANEETAAEPELEAPELEAPELSESEVENWEATQFQVRLDLKTIQGVYTSTVYRQAEEAAQRLLADDPLADARHIIDSHVSGELRGRMLLVLDWTVFQKAEEAARKILPKDPLSDAKSIIQRYAATDRSRLDMELALDKHVFQKAEEAAHRILPKDPLGNAKEIITKYASVPQRRDAMLKRLGFM
jgi:hypothetical protein